MRAKKKNCIQYYLDLTINNCYPHFRCFFSILFACLIGVIFTFIYFQRSTLSSLIKETSFIYKSSLIKETSFIYKSSPPIIDRSISIRSTVFDGCGTWQEDYIARHRAILNGNLPPRYLISVAVDTDLADRLTGTLTEFVFALLTNRAFQIITYGTLPRFEAAFLSPHINWSRPTDNDTLIDNLKYTYRGQHGYTGDRSYGPNADTNLYWPVYLINNEDANVFFVNSNVSQHPIGHDNVPTLFVASNRGRIVRLFDNPYHRSQLFRMGLRPEIAAKCVFNFLFSPTDELRKAMSREFLALQSIDTLKISVNIRAGDFVFDPAHDGSTALESFEPYFDCALEIEKFARLPNQSVIWYFTSDSLRLRQLVKQRYGEKVLTEDKLRYFHGDCGDSHAKNYGNCTKESQDLSIRMAAGQIYAMSMCDYHVVSFVSGFGRFATILSHYWHNVYQVHTKTRSCSLADADPIEKVTADGSGI